MTLIPAPLHFDVADAPENGNAFWLTASDGVRIRVGVWSKTTDIGTVLLFPGRTEYVEKYGRAARELQDRDLSVLVIDWRGQGIADRLVKNRKIGHVKRFGDYQKDVAAVLDAAGVLELPKPFTLLGHSMGGCIGLRALIEGLPVNSATFTAPMWGIQLGLARRILGWTLPTLSRFVGLQNMLAPGTIQQPYVQVNPFPGNSYTTDARMYEYMQNQIDNYPELSLAGPSMLWCHEALYECFNLSRAKSPDYPVTTFLGGKEKIVDIGAVEKRMKVWRGAEFIQYPYAEHEIMMEGEEIQKQVFDAVLANITNNSAD